MAAARRLLPVLVVLAFLFSGGVAHAAGGSYTITGGSPEAQAQVRAALERSAFDWDVVPATIDIRITNCGCAGARPGLIVLDEAQLTSTVHGVRHVWGIVQHEYAHQVDYFLLGQSERSTFSRRFGGRAWCYEVAGLGHDDYGCERFATLVAWAYWRSPANVARPDWRSPRAPKLKRVAVRRFVARLLASSAA